MTQIVRAPIDPANTGTALCTVRLAMAIDYFASVPLISEHAAEQRYDRESEIGS